MYACHKHQKAFKSTFQTLPGIKIQFEDIVFFSAFQKESKFYTLKIMEDYTKYIVLYEYAEDKPDRIVVTAGLNDRCHKSISTQF